MLGRNGFVRAWLEDIGVELPSIYGFFGILLVFSLKFYPFVFLLASSSLRAINPSMEEAAEGLGAGPWRRFFGVTLPLIFPAVSAGALLTFVLSIADFGKRRRSSAARCACWRPPPTTSSRARWAAIRASLSATSVVLIVLSMSSSCCSAGRCAGATSRDRSSASQCRSAFLRFASIVAHIVCYAIVLASSLPSIVVSIPRSAGRADPSSTRASGSTAIRGSCAKCRT